MLRLRVSVIYYVTELLQNTTECNIEDVTETPITQSEKNDSGALCHSPITTEKRDVTNAPRN